MLIYLSNDCSHGEGNPSTVSVTGMEAMVVVMMEVGSKALGVGLKQESKAHGQIAS